MSFRFVRSTKKEMIDYYNKLFSSNEALYKEGSISREVFLSNKKNIELNFEFDMLYYKFTNFVDDEFVD